MLSDSYRATSAPVSGLRRRHSGDKRALNQCGELHQETQLYRQSSREDQQIDRAKLFFDRVEEDDEPEVAALGPAGLATATPALSSSSEQSSSSGWARSGVLKRVSSLGIPLPRIHMPQLKSSTASAGAGSSKQQATAATAFVITPAPGAARNRGAVSATAGKTAEDDTSTDLSSQDCLDDVAGGPGPDQDHSKTNTVQCFMYTETGHYMDVSAPTESAGSPSTKLLLATAAGVMRGMKQTPSKDIRKIE